MMNLNHYEEMEHDDDEEYSLELVKEKYKELCRYTPSYFTDEEILDVMNYIADYSDDPEEAHIMADKLLCEMLRRDGHSDLVHAWSQVYKWYS